MDVAAALSRPPGEAREVIRSLVSRPSLLVARRKGSLR